MKQITGQNPFKIFSDWFDEAKLNDKVKDHTEMCLATADSSGRPSARIVLLKNFDERGFVFFTNYNGRKSEEIIQNPYASICFYWPALEKQIRIEGKVIKISDIESDEYFNSRPEESRIGAITSKQSKPLESREKFLTELEETRKTFENKEIKRPQNWGGWRISPDKIEFWQAAEFRIHQRDVFSRKTFEPEDTSWNNEILYP